MLRLLATFGGLVAFFGGWAPARAAVGPCDPEHGLFGLVCVVGQADSTRESLARRSKFLGEAEMGALKRRARSESSVSVFIASIQKLLDGSHADLPLAIALRDPGSPESALWGQYVRFIAARSPNRHQDLPDGVKYGLSNFDAFAFLDLAMTRLTLEGHAVPPEVLGDLSRLTQGGLERVSVAADSFMLNESLNDIHALQDKMAGPAPVPRSEIHAAIRKIARADGGTPVHIQPPRKEGEYYPFRRRIAPEQHALVLRQGSQMLVPAEQEGTREVAEQWEPFYQAVQRIEKALAEMPPDSPLTHAKLEAFRSYQHIALYRPQELGRVYDLIDLLAVATVEKGSVEDCRKFDLLLYDWIENLGTSLRGSRRGESVTPEGRMYDEILELVATRENWNESTVRFVLDELEHLAHWNQVLPHSAEEIKRQFEEIERVRLAETPSVAEIEKTLTEWKEGSEPVSARWGGFRFKLEVKPRPVAGFLQKTLAVHDIDGPEVAKEAYERLLTRLEKVAGAHGIEGFEIANLHHIHRERWFDAERPDFTRFEFLDRKYWNLDREVPTYYKSLVPLAPEQDHQIWVAASDSIDNWKREQKSWEWKEYRRKKRVARIAETGDPVPAELLKESSRDPEPPPAPRPDGFRPELPNGDFDHDLAAVCAAIEHGVVFAFVSVGTFRFDIRPRWIFLNGRTIRALNFADIINTEPGSGMYPNLLLGLAKAAQAAGYGGILADNVSLSQHHRFYERLGFEAVKHSGPLRAYLLDFDRPFTQLAAARRSKASCLLARFRQKVFGKKPSAPRPPAPAE